MKKLFAMLLDLSRPFWGKRQNWRAWLLLATILAIGFGVVYLNIRINEWSKSFYDALGAFDSAKLYGLVKEYSLYIAIYIGIYVYQDWLIKLLTIQWRGALTEQLIDSWFAKRAFYRLSLNGKMDNPDQRIAEDIDLFVTKTLELLTSFIINFAQLSSFVIILWNLSGVQQFTLWGKNITLYGYLVWMAVIYTLLGSLITHWIGKKLHGLNYQKQKAEADFRASLLRKHDNAEQIALYGGENQEKRHLKRNFSAIVTNWRAMMNSERNLGFFTVGYGRISMIVPIFAALPAFLNKTVTLGGLMQIRSAFSQVYSALSWFVRAYHLLVTWSATLERLSQFKQAILDEQREQPSATAGHELVTQDLSLSTPQGMALLNEIKLHCPHGSWNRISGESGLGKSTLLRTLSGLWPYYSGSWKIPQGRNLLLPQQSYLGQGTLAELLCYPQAGTVEPEYLREILHKVGLSGWQDRLDMRLNWERIFSGGERQRLAFARALINQPDTLYLDEATSNLDTATARELLLLLKQYLPHCTLVVITHQNGLADLFEYQHDLSQFRQSIEVIPAAN
ncbi:putative membrane transport ATP-binding protein [Yersinia mollaretii]|nr:ABC transporter ATP-binding protein [Yersinia mollaretii]CQD41339.1 putative membrane transport ATP-binding protein [Yersinia mollaretii]CQH28431.1 putative membrane transport ATP-binding protein [Yersinia mollaretii]